MPQPHPLSLSLERRETAVPLSFLRRGAGVRSYFSTVVYGGMVFTY